MREKKTMSTFKFVLSCIGVFILFAVLGATSKTIKPLWTKDYKVDWNDSVGTVHKDISYGSGKANKFDIYVPADSNKKEYSLVVYLHPGGFTTGDKSGDAEMLEWLCSKGYVTAGINYTLFSKENPRANVYTQSMDIKRAMPKVVSEAAKLGYPIKDMAIAGGSSGHCLAMLYAYRDADTSPVPVKMVFGAVGLTSFYPKTGRVTASIKERR